MSVDLKTAASAVPKVITGSLAASDAYIYTCPVGVTATVRKVRLTNVDGSARDVTLSIVPAGGSSGVTNRLMSGESVPAAPTTGYRLDLGGGDVLNEGDAIWGFAPSSTNVDYLISVIEFGGGVGGALTGIQDDAIGTGGHGTGSATGSVKIGTAANRYLAVPMMVQEASASAVWSAYTALGVTCNDGSGALTMTRLVSIDFTNSGGTVCGSVHWFGRANCTSGSTQALTGTAAATGATMGVVLGAPIALSGVASVTGAASAASGSGAAALSLPITSAVGHRAFVAGLFFDVPQDFNLRVRSFNGITSGFAFPKWLLAGDALGAATVTGTTSNTTQWAAAGFDAVPA